MNVHRRVLLKQLAYLLPILYAKPASLAASLAQKAHLDSSSNNCCGHFVVVGAGVSGLYAAAQLVAAGASVTILEASDRHGGRIRPLEDFADFTVELGAENVHGMGNQNGTPPSFLYHDMDAYNPALLKLLNNQDSLLAIDNTTVWDSETNDPDILQVWQLINWASDYSGADISVAQYLENVWGIDENHRTRHFYEAYVGAEYGTSLDRISMRGYAAQEYLWLTGGKDYAIDGSYLEVLEQLYFNPILPNIQYNTAVTAINYSGSGVVVSDQNGNQYVGNGVVITVPITVLKDGDIGFTPALPAAKVAAINSIGMGAGMKIILKFSSAFWDTDRMFDLLCKGYTTECWAAGKLKTGATNNILTCFIMGERAEYMGAQANNAINIALAELDTLFGGNVASTHFVDGYIMNWTQHPYIRGAYSYPIAATYPNSGPPSGTSQREILAQAVQNKVFFAGEATNNHHSATVHGALESAARVVGEVCAAYPANIPNTIIINGQQNVCAGNTKAYSVAAIANTTYTWTVNGGTIVSGQGTPQITVWWNGSEGSISVVQSY